MARPARIALDLALESLVRVRPAVSRAWAYTREYVENSAARPLVANPVVNKLESAVSLLTNFLEKNMKYLRNQQLPKEEKYLLRQLEIVKQKMAEAAGSKKLKEAGAIVWAYLKVEAAPPLTVGILHGFIGRKIESTAGRLMDFISSKIDNQIKAIKFAEELEKRKKEAAAKAAILKKVAEDIERREKEMAAILKYNEEVRKAAAAKAEAKAKEEAKKAGVKPVAGAKPGTKPGAKPGTKPGAKPAPKPGPAAAKTPEKGKKK